MIHPSMSAYADVPLWACTTLNRLKAAQACPRGYHKFARFLKEQWPAVGADDPVPLLLALLNSNDFNDVLWAFRMATCASADRQLRELACDFAEHTLPIFEKSFPEDKRPREALRVSRSFARGEASGLALQEARRSADAAAAATYADATTYAADAVAYAAGANAADAAYATAYAAYTAGAVLAHRNERNWQRERLACVLRGESRSGEPAAEALHRD